MAAAPSQLFSLLFDKETTEGTEVNATVDFGLVQECDIVPTNTILENPAFGSRNVDTLEFGEYTAEGKIRAFWQHGRILELALGTVGHAGAGDPYTHTYTEANTLPSFTVEKAVNFATGDDIVETFTGCKVDSLELTLGTAGVLEWSARVLGMSSNTTDVTATAASIASLPTFPSSTATVSIGVDASEVAIGQVTNMTFRINNNLLRLPQFGARTPAGHAEGSRRYEGTITAAFDATTEYPWFYGLTGTTSPQNTAIQTTTILIALTRDTATRTLNIELNGVALERIGTAQRLGEVVYQELGFKAKSIGTVTSKDSISSTAWSGSD